VSGGREGARGPLSEGRRKANIRDADIQLLAAYVAAAELAAGEIVVDALAALSWRPSGYSTITGALAAVNAAYATPAVFGGVALGNVATGSIWAVGGAALGTAASGVVGAAIFGVGVGTAIDRAITSLMGQDLGSYAYDIWEKL